MPLYLADIYLTRARLFARTIENGTMKYPWRETSPQSDLVEARRLIEECHYRCRLGELEDAEMAILHPEKFDAYIADLQTKEKEERGCQEAELKRKLRSQNVHLSLIHI